MDIGEIEARLPSITDINDQLVDFVKDYVCKKTSSILVRIAQNENLPRDKLISYIHEIDFDDISHSIVTKKPRKVIDTKDRCFAKTSKGDQCTRKKRHEHFCGSHQNSRPYGEFQHKLGATKNKPCIRVRETNKIV